MDAWRELLAESRKWVSDNSHASTAWLGKTRGLW